MPEFSIPEVFGMFLFHGTVNVEDEENVRTERLITFLPFWISILEK